ncbi:MAG TPA: hypothetical protein VH165_18920 [Kofleriaceae bacterium]|jgi:hypothetical protein|nr:hypothetical protein [Kofleriaceae bacterium]
MFVLRGCFALAIAPWLTLALAGALAACGNGDDTNDGTRAECAQGGALTACPEAERTAEGACWRLVDCGAIPVSSDNTNRFTWGKCADAIESATDDRQRLVIDCIAASTCDELQVKNSPGNPNPNDFPCLRIGGL